MRPIPVESGLERPDQMRPEQKVQQRLQAAQNLTRTYEGRTGRSPGMLSQWIGRLWQSMSTAFFRPSPAPRHFAVQAPVTPQPYNKLQPVPQFDVPSKSFQQPAAPSPSPATPSKLDVRVQPVQPPVTVVFPKTQPETTETLPSLKDCIDRMFAALRAYTGDAPNADPTVRAALDAYAAAFLRSPYYTKMREADALNGGANKEMLSLAQSGDLEGLRKVNTAYSQRLGERGGAANQPGVVLNDEQLLQLRDGLLRDAAKTRATEPPLARFTKLLDIAGNAPGYQLTVTGEGTITVGKKGQAAPESRDNEPKDLADSIVRLVAALNAYKGSAPDADPAIRSAVRTYVEFFKRSPEYADMMFYDKTDEDWFNEIKPLALVNNRSGIRAVNEKYSKILKDRGVPANLDNRYMRFQLPENPSEVMGYLLTAKPKRRTPLQEYTAKLNIGQFAPGYRLTVAANDAISATRQ